MEYAFGFLHSASKIGESSGNTVIIRTTCPPSKKWSNNPDKSRKYGYDNELYMTSGD